MTFTESATAVPLSQPLYGATFGQAVRRYFVKFATFSGRASRSEYWWTILFRILVLLPLSLIVGEVASATSVEDSDGTSRLTAPGVVAIVILFVVLVGLQLLSISVTVRRLHDADLSGLLFLLVLVPYVGGFTIFILTLLGSKSAGARFDSPSVTAELSTPDGSPTLAR